MDVILRIQWLETLGKCEVDWKEQSLSFAHRGNKITLHGDKSLHCNKFSFKSLSPVYTTSKSGREVLFTSSIATSTIPDSSHQLSRLLLDFADVFAVPTALPPL